MSDTTTDGSQPPKAPNDSEERDDSGGQAVSDALQEYRENLTNAREEAIDYLDEQVDIETDWGLYAEAGHQGETHQVELELYGAEIYVLVDLLDRLTNEPQDPGTFVAQTGALDEIVAKAPTEQILTWLAAPDRDLAEAVKGDDDQDDDQDDEPDDGGSGE